MKTHRWILIVLALLGSGLPVNAQDQTATSPNQVLATEYVSPDHRFKIRFPDTPKEFDLPLTETGQIVSHSVMHTSIVTYWLGYIDSPINFEQANAIKATLDKARDGSLARVAKEEPRIVAESDISVDGYPGRFLRVELKGDAITRYKIVLAGNRQYMLIVGTPKGDPKNPQVLENYEKLATSFFDSFKITPPLEADLTATWKEFSSTAGKYRIQFPGAPFQRSFDLEALGSSGVYFFTAYASAGQYTVAYIDFADAPAATDRAGLKEFLDDLREGQFDIVRQQGAKITVVSETDITFDGYPARFMVVGLNDVTRYRVKTIVVKNRVYSIGSVMPKDDPKASDPKAYEKLSLKFIESFKLMKEAVKQQEE